MASVKEVLKIARNQIGVCESPANSNRTKYGKDYGWNGTFWCAIFAWWCGWMADGKKTKTIAKNASDAYIQEETVKLGGSWVMKKNKSKDTRKNYLTKAKPGDLVSFDFGAMDAVRDHTGLVESVSGNYLICIEGNTSESGSQSNGGMVCRQRRIYTSVCSAVRPKYSDQSYKPQNYTGSFPALPERGFFRRGDEGAQVRNVQRFVNWAVDYGLDVDGEYGPKTVRGVMSFQRAAGITADGEFGKTTLSKARSYKR